MTLQAVEWLGLVAACCTTFAFLPQAIKTIRDKDTKSISLGMYVLFTFGVGLWLIYGLWLGALPVILANAGTLLIALVILTLKLRYG